MTTTNPRDVPQTDPLEVLRRERPLVERPDVLATHDAVTTARGNLVTATADVERAEQELGVAEADAASAAFERGGEIDQRHLDAVRRRLSDAQSSQRIRLAAVRQAERRAADAAAQARDEIVAQCRAVYQERVVAFDAAVAAAAVINRDLHTIATVGCGLLCGERDLDDLVYWPPLTGETPNYLRWRQLVVDRGFALPPPSPAHTVPAAASSAPAVSFAGRSNPPAGANVFTVVVGPGGQWKPTSRAESLPPDVHDVGRVVSALLAAAWVWLR